MPNILWRNSIYHETAFQIGNCRDGKEEGKGKEKEREDREENTVREIWKIKRDNSKRERFLLTFIEKN